MALICAQLTVNAPEPISAAVAVVHIVLVQAITQNADKNKTDLPS